MANSCRTGPTGGKTTGMASKYSDNSDGVWNATMYAVMADSTGLSIVWSSFLALAVKGMVNCARSFLFGCSLGYSLALLLLLLVTR